MEIMVPKTLNELLPNINNNKRRIAAGCTDIMVSIRSSKINYMPVIDINKINEIKKIFLHEDSVYIGSNVNLSDILDNNIINKNFPILNRAIETIGSPQIRNRATLGGNIANASPSGDSLVPLILLNATIILKSLEGQRQILIDDFIKGVGKTDLRNNEFIQYICIPLDYINYVSYFEKVGLRSSMTISVTSMGTIYKLEDGIIKNIKIAYAAVAPKVLRIYEAEDYLNGKKLDKNNLMKASEIIFNTVAPIDDIRASKDYRKLLCKNLIMRLLEI